MNPKTMSVLGLGALAASSLFRNNRVDAKPEFTIPGILVNNFVSEKYKVSFDYPKTWMKNPRYEDKYEGTTGFFEVSDFSGMGENIDEAVQAQIHEPYQPYGSNPTVTSMEIDGQPARVIYPSLDQNKFVSDRDIALVVQYPTPVELDGETYKYVVIWATPEYMPLIINSFKFV